MNLKDCKVRRETEDFFEIERAGKPLKVAKKGLRPAMVVAIQKFAQGGQVQPVTTGPITLDLGAGALNPSMLTAPGVAAPGAFQPASVAPAQPAQSASAPPTPEQVAAFERAANPLGAVGSPPTGWVSPSKEAAEQAGVGGIRKVADVASNIGNAWLAGLGVGTDPAATPPVPAQEAAAMTQAAPVAVDAMPVTPGTGAAPRRVGVGIPRTDTREIDAALAQQLEGVNAQTEAAAMESAEREAILREREQAQRDLRERFDSEMAELTAKRLEVEQELRDGKINPARFWGQKDTGQKVAAGVAMMLGGFGGALMRTGRNGVADMFEKMVEQDIQAQRDDRQNKQNLLNSYMQQGRDAASAYGLAKADLVDLAATQIEIASAKYGGEKARAAALQVAGELRLKAEATRRAAVAQDIQNAVARSAIAANNAQARAAEQKGQMDASQAALNAALARGEEIPIEVVGNLDPKVQKRLVQVAPGKYAAATSEEGAKEVRQAQAAAGQLRALVGQMRALREKVGSGEFFDRGAVAQGASLKQQALLQIKDLANLGVLSESDRDIVDELIRDPADFQTDAGFNAAMGELDRMINTRLNSTMNANLMRRAQPTLTPRTAADVANNG